MAPQKGAHQETDAQAYAGLPAFKHLVRSGFQEADYSDFTIRCGGKSFKVHKFVLQSIKYFRNIFNGYFKESVTGQVDLQEDNADIIELLLAVVYGADYGRWVASRCGRATEAAKLVQPLEITAPVDGKSRSLHASSADLCIPTHECIALKKSEHEWRQVLAAYRGRTMLPEALSEYFCKELQMHVDAYVTADKYEVEEVKEAAKVTFSGLLTDCWQSPKVLGVIKRLIAGPLGTQNALASTAIRGLACRLSMYTPIGQLVDDLSRHQPDVARLILKQLFTGPLAHETNMSAMRFCTLHTCRRNVKPMIPDGGREYCPSCGNGVYLQPAWLISI